MLSKTKNYKSQKTLSTNLHLTFTNFENNANNFSIWETRLMSSWLYSEDRLP